MSSWSDKYKRSIDCAGRKKRSLKEAGRPYSAKYMKELLKAGQGKTADTVNVKIPKSGHFMDEETLKKEACWDSHKQVGFKMKKGKRVPNCVPRNEDAPVNSVGGGKVAGLGVGPQGEPGVPVKRKKKKLMPFIMYMKRKNV